MKEKTFKKRQIEYLITYNLIAAVEWKQRMSCTQFILYNWILEINTDNGINFQGSNCLQNITKSFESYISAVQTFSVLDLLPTRTLKGDTSQWSRLTLSLSYSKVQSSTYLKSKRHKCLNHFCTIFLCKSYLIFSRNINLY